jgi:hypothetical protein
VPGGGSDHRHEPLAVIVDIWCKIPEAWVLTRREACAMPYLGVCRHLYHSICTFEHNVDYGLLNLLKVPGTMQLICRKYIFEVLVDFS